MIIRSLGNILFNGFTNKLSYKDERLTKVTLQHFRPINHWTANDKPYGIWHLEDGDHIYEFKFKFHARNQSLGLLLASPILQPIGLSVNLINRLVKIVTFSHLWHKVSKPITLKARLFEMEKDLLRIVVTPFAYLGFIFAASYGILSPYNGRKLYATFERAIYGGGAETFETKRHVPVRSFLSNKFHPYE